MVKSSIEPELCHLRTFVVAADCGSFRKAAQSLCINQSAVSRRILDLEDRLGVSLFHRHSTGVKLTHAGCHFLRSVRSILSLTRNAVCEASLFGCSEVGNVRIGIYSSLASGFLPELIQAYRQKFSRVRVDFIEGASHEHIAAVRQLHVDVAFVAEESGPDDCDKLQLWKERVHIVLPAGHELAHKTAIGWSDISDAAFIVSDVPPGEEVHRYLVKRLERMERCPTVHVQKVGRDNLFTLVALGRGLTLTSEATVAARIPGVVFRPMSNEFLQFSAIWSPQNDNPAFRTLLSMAKQMRQQSLHAPHEAPRTASS